MIDILPDCIKVLHLLTDLYKNNILTRDEYIEHSRLKIAFLSEQIQHIVDIQDKKDIMLILMNCRNTLVSSGASQLPN